MSNSVKKRMLITTLSLFVTAWLVTVVSTYFSLTRQAQLSHDQDLQNYALIIQGFSHRLINESEEESTALKIEQQLAAQYDITLAFNIFHQGRVVAKSKSAPNFPQSKVVAARSIELQRDGETEAWRVYSHYSEDDDVWIVVGETREAIGAMLRLVIFQAIWPNMVFLPLMLFAIVIGVRQSLKPLIDLAGHVEVQTPQYLAPIEIDDVPLEVEPLVRSLNHLLERLRVAFDNEHAFTANAAHELRTPLGALKTEAQILRQLDLPEPAEKAVQRMEARVDRAAHLLAQLLTMARMEADGGFEDLQQVDLVEVLQEVLEDIAVEARERQVEIVPVCKQPCPILGEPPAMTILLRNLIDNAVRYSPPGGCVSVTLDRLENRVRLVVADQGPGIPSDKLNEVFKKFYRAPGMRESGAGLGLSIVERIVHLHNASIELSQQSFGSGLRVEVVFQNAV